MSSHLYERTRITFGWMNESALLTFQVYRDILNLGILG